MKQTSLTPFLRYRATAFALVLATTASAQKNENNFSNVDDIGFDQMDDEAARLGDPADNMFENQASPLNAEFKDDMPDLPDNNAGGTFDEGGKAKGKVKAAAPAAKKAAAKPVTPTTEAPVKAPTVVPAAASVAQPAAPAPQKVTPAAQASPVPAQKAVQNQPPATQQPVSEKSLTPTAPAASVPKISGETDVSGTPENTAMEPSPGEEVASPPPVQPVAQPTQPQTKAAATPAPPAQLEPAAAPALQGGAIPTENVELPADQTTATPAFVDHEGQSPGPDQGPVPKELIPMNEFGGAPAFPGSRRIMAEGEAPEEYKVDPGDTLFDICDQLVDDPGYWPKLWALNPEIANPHFIYPGMKLRFYPGDDEMPPFLQVVSEDELVPVDNAELSPQQLVREDIDHLLYREKSQESEKKAVDAPDFVTDDELKNIDLSQEFDDVGTFFVPTNFAVLIPAFVYEEEVTPLGIVKSGATGELLTGANAKVLVKAEEGGGMSSGTLYTVVRPSGELKRPSDNERIGYRYDFIAQIKVTRTVGEATIGEVVLNRLGIEPGDIVMSYASVNRKVPINVGAAAPTGGGSQVLAFEDPRSVVGGNRSLVLIDKSNGDLAAGSTILMYQDTARFQSRFISHKIPDLSRAVAKVHIIDSSTKVAIGMVMGNVSELYVGDYAGAPPSQLNSSDD